MDGGGGVSSSGGRSQHQWGCGWIVGEESAAVGRRLDSGGGVSSSFAELEPESKKREAQQAAGGEDFLVVSFAV